MHVVEAKRTLPTTAQDRCLVPGSVFEPGEAREHGVNILTGLAVEVHEVGHGVEAHLFAQRCEPDRQLGHDERHGVLLHAVDHAAVLELVEAKLADQVASGAFEL